MIFAGDIALPHKNAIDYTTLPKDLYSKNWIGNLEGAIVVNDDNSIKGVYNHKNAIEELVLKFNFKAFSLANNHIFDTGSLEKTIGFLKSKSIKYGGIGVNISEANKEILIEENGQQVVVINFGWEVIQCEVTTGNFPGVNPLRKEHVVNTVENLLIKYPKAKIIPFIHWSYELEAEPQPFERELAKNLIDMGVAGVIGCHPHRIGGFERYKNKPIVYSLGNFLFKQNHYYNSTLKFPDFCKKQLAFEWDFNSNNFIFHILEYATENDQLNYIEAKSENDFIKAYTPFSGLTNSEYKTWYRKNHYHKNKGLPIYYWEDKPLTTKLKNKLVRMRDKGIKYILNKGK